MSEILRPDEVQALTVRVTTERLCRDYLTLWDRNKELEKEREFWQDRARGLVEKARNVGGT